MRKLAHISDLHFGRHSETAAEALLESVEQTMPDLVVISGDFTQRARTSEFIAARRFLDRIAQPKLLVPGNHDIPLYNVFNRFLRPLRGYRRHVEQAGQTLDIYRDDELMVLGINTARSFARKNGRVSTGQLADLAQIFGSSPPAVLKVLVTHHPLAHPEGSPLAQLARRSGRAMSAVKLAGVRLLLSGHHHTASSGGNIEVEANGGVLVLYAGTAISTRTRGGEGNSYNLLEIGPDSVRVRVLGLDGARFRELRRTRFSLVAGHWRPGEWL